MKIAKWIGLALGATAFDGPAYAFLGSIGGFLLGAVLDEIGALLPGRAPKPLPRAPLRPEELADLLMPPVGAVLRAKGEELPLETVFLRNHLYKLFGREKAEHWMALVPQRTMDSVELHRWCRRARTRLDAAERRLLLDFWFGIANADYHIGQQQTALLQQIALGLQIPARDYHAIKAFHTQEVDAAYKILQIRPSASEKQIREAYPKTMDNWAPGSFARLGKGAKLMAAFARARIRKAYRSLARERNFAA